MAEAKDVISASVALMRPRSLMHDLALTCLVDELKKDDQRRLREQTRWHKE